MGGIALACRLMDGIALACRMIAGIALACRLIAGIMNSLSSSCFMLTDGEEKTPMTISADMRRKGRLIFMLFCSWTVEINV